MAEQEVFDIRGLSSGRTKGAVDRSLLGEVVNATESIGKVPLGAVGEMAGSVVNNISAVNQFAREEVRFRGLDETIGSVLNPLTTNTVGFSVEEYFQEENDVPIDTTAYEALESVGIKLTDTEKTFADVGALIMTAMSATNKINSIPSIAKALGSNSWLKASGVNLAVGATADLTSHTTE